MNKELKHKWVEALRSGEYKQGYALMHDDKRHTFCCLGVLVDIAKIDSPDRYNWCDRTLGHKANHLINLNDAEHPFKEIADWIEANIPADIS